MHQRIIDYIYNFYKQKGYVSEDAIFDALVEYNISLDEIDSICGTLLSMGVLIKNDDVNEDEDGNISDRSQIDYEQIYKEVIEIDESLAPFIDEIRNIIPPQDRECSNLIIQAQNGNRYALERIVSMYLRLVIKAALYYHQRYNISLAEAILDGCVGLIVSIEKFEIEKQNNFSQYAPWWIRQSILREAELQGSFVRFPVHYKDKLFLAYDIVYERYCKRFIEQEICPVLIEQVLQKVNCNYNEAEILIKNLFPALSCEEQLEIDDNIFNDYGIFEEELQEKLDYEKLKKDLSHVLDTLEERERKVIELRFGLGENAEPKTLAEIGAVFNVTRERIRQIESKAIKKLKHRSRSVKIKSYW